MEKITGLLYQKLLAGAKDIEFLVISWLVAKKSVAQLIFYCRFWGINKEAVRFYLLYDRMTIVFVMSTDQQRCEY